MKKFILPCSLALLLGLSSCGEPASNKEDDAMHQQEHTVQSEKIKDLETKLTATEAQLLNVKSELSKYKAADSTGAVKASVEK